MENPIPLAPPARPIFHQGPPIEAIVHAVGPTTVGQLTEATIYAIREVQSANPDREIWLGSGKVTEKLPNGQRDDKQSRSNEEALMDAMESFQARHPGRIATTSGYIMSAALRAALAPSAPQHGDYVTMWAGKNGVIARAGLGGVFMIGRRDEKNYWRGSIGARAERRRALALGIPVEYEDPTIYQHAEQSIPAVRRISSLVSKAVLLFYD